MYKKELANWVQSTNERQKLQWTYAAVTIIGLIAAGLIGLIDTALARNILQIVTVAFGLFVANFVVWALIRTFIDEPVTQAAVPQKPARLISKK